MVTFKLKKIDNADQSDLMLESIRRKVNDVRKKKKIISILSGVLWCSNYFIGLGFFFIIIETLFWLPPFVRMTIVLVYIFSCFIFGILWIGCPLFSLFFQRNKPSEDTIALEMGLLVPSVRDRLVDALQVYRNRGQEQKRTSQELSIAALSDINQEIHSIDFRKLISFRNLVAPLKWLCGILFISILINLFFPDSMRNGLYRLNNPDRRYERPVPFQFLVYPGDIQVVQGATVIIRVEIKGRKPERIAIGINSKDEEPYEIILKPPFVYRIESVRKNFVYVARSGHLQSRIHTVKVLELPAIRVLQVILKPPAYSRRDAQTLESNIGDIEALIGTNVELFAKINKPINQATLIFEKGKCIKLFPNGQIIHGTFLIRENDRYWIHLEDKEKLINTDPIKYTIRTKPDAFPVARILYPPKNVDLDEGMFIPLSLEAEDDFGISDVRIGFSRTIGNRIHDQRSDTVFIPIPFSGKEPVHVQTNWNWDLNSLGVLPKDRLLYFFEATDNDRVSGPKLARSETHTVRFPSIEEIYGELEKEQTDQMRTLTEMADNTRSIRDEMDHLNEQIKTGKDIGWDDRKNLNEKTDRQAEAVKQFNTLKDKLDNLIDRMEKNDLINIQTLQKYQELEQLYEEIATPELMDLMKKMREVLQRVSEEDIKKALKQYQFSQESFLRSIERTISLLKRLRIEQKTDELIRRIQEMIQKQNEIQKSMETEKKQELPNLVSRQNDIVNDAEIFKDETEKLQRSMKELNQMPMKQMEAVISSVQIPDLSDAVRQMQMDLRDGNRRGASSRGKPIIQQMQAIERSLTEMKKKLQADQFNRITEGMRRISIGFLDLSQEQEELIQGMKEGRISKIDSEEKQLSINETLNQKADSLYRLSKETFFVSPEMGKTLGEAKLNMQQSLEQMQSSYFGSTMLYQEKAMGALNKMVIMILKEMSHMTQGSGSGLENFFLQLENMGNEQAAINRRMMDMLNQGGLSMEQQASVVRMAAEQESLKQRLQNLIQEYGNRSDIAGNLDSLVKEMESAVKQMESYKADRQTVRIQERILSRLLDIQHSLYQQGQLQKRQAKMGKDIIQQGPRLIENVTSKKLERIRKDLLEAINEGYTKEYVELIQKYFDALSKTYGE